MSDEIFKVRKSRSTKKDDTDVIDAEVKGCVEVTSPQTAMTDVTQNAVDALKKKRTMLVVFVKTQLKKDVHYGKVFKGQKKDSLFKPGAEMLAQLFNLGSRIIDRSKEIDHENNFAMFEITVEVYHIPTGKALAQMPGSANSQESGKKNVALADQLNSLQKMAHKRAYVGAIIQATGASDFFTQDIDDSADAEALGISPRNHTQAEEDRKPENPQGVGGMAPMCCRMPMMISLYQNDTWYCKTCKRKEAMG